MSFLGSGSFPCLGLVTKLRFVCLIVKREGIGVLASCHWLIGSMHINISPFTYNAGKLATCQWSMEIFLANLRHWCLIIGDISVKFYRIYKNIVRKSEWKERYFGFFVRVKKKKNPNFFNKISLYIYRLVPALLRQSAYGTIKIGVYYSLKGFYVRNPEGRNIYNYM